MAITKTIPTPKGTGNEVVHHVIRNITINKKDQTLSIVVSSYHAPLNYNEGSHPSEIKEYTKKFSELPAGITTSGMAFLDAIESAMVVGLPPYTGGTLVNDDGTTR